MQVLDESSFLNVLRIERKRIERSGQNFVLMLLEGGRLLNEPENRLAFDRFLDALLRSTRETDYKGWYGQESVFGIIFVDILDASNETVRQALQQKVEWALSSTLTTDQIKEVKFSFHVFPEPGAGCNSSGASNLILYRDIVRDFDSSRRYNLLKRSLDVLGSLLGLILLSPLFLAIATAIRVTSRGPVLFRQERVGQYFKRFTFLKFRSMYVDSNDAIHKEYVAKLIAGQKDKANGNASGRTVFKITKDPRITRVGRFLRKTSLDELPQLLNVLRGEMTLVGPRPCTAYEFDCYKLWHRQRLLGVKPGITGLWQVKGRSSVDFDDMVRLDLAYVESRSFWLDVKILLQTPRVVLAGHGAY